MPSRQWRHRLLLREEAIGWKLSELLTPLNYQLEQNCPLVLELQPPQHQVRQWLAPRSFGNQGLG
jgi:hypothetical protein